MRLTFQTAVGSPQPQEAALQGEWITTLQDWEGDLLG